MKCTTKDCGREGRHQIGMKLPALGYARGSHHPALSLTSLVVCDRCKHSIALNDILTDEGKQIITGAFLERGKAPPDFSRAELHFEKIKGGKLKGGLDGQAGHG